MSGRGAARSLTALALGLLLTPAAVQAAPEEIQIYLDDVTTPGHFGLDVHNNYAWRSSQVPEYDGARPPDGVYRLTPEFYYGLTPSFELGVYVLTARDRDHAVHVDGEKVRLKYIAPHDAAQGAFWGLNLEVGRSDAAVAERPWNYELKGILGERFGRWLVAVNANLDSSLSAHGGAATLDLDTRLGYGLRPDTQLAIEAYDELGKASGPGGLHDLSHVVYVVLDTDLKACDLSVGIGRGLTAASDGWVAKAIVGFHF